MGVLTFSKLEPGKEFRPDVTPVKVTWAYLKEIKEKGNLIPGQYYRITDYVTTTAQPETQSAGHPFDILVRADDATTLSETAYAVQHDGDTYFQNAKMEAWLLKYCLDNDYDRFAWCQRNSIVISNQEYLRSEADDVSGANYPYCWKLNTTKRYTNTATPVAGTDVAKANTAGTGSNYAIQTVNTIDDTQRGVIYWMQDEFGNCMPFDFKNIQFKRYKITATSKMIGTTEVLAALKNTYLGFRQLDTSGGTGSLYPQNCTMSTSETRFSFALSLNGTTDLTLQTNNHCYDNVVEPYFVGTKQWLNNVTLQATSATADSYNNHIDGTSQSISMGSGCYNNSITGNSYSNTLSSDSYNNTLSSSGYNTLSSSYGNTLSSSGENTLSSSGYNTLSSSGYNTLSSSGYNTLSSSYYNTLSSSDSNTLSSSDSNTLSSDSYNNTLSSSYSNTLSSNFFAELIGCYNGEVPEGSAYEQGIGGYMVDDGLYIKNYGQRRSVTVFLAECDDEENPVLDTTLTLEAGQVYYLADTYFEPSEDSQMTFTEGGKTHKYGFFCI